MMLVTAMKAKIRIVCPLLRAAGHNFDCDAGGWTWSAPSVQPAPFAHQQTLRSHPLACVTLSSTPWRSINIGCDKLSTRHLELGVWYPAGWVPLLHIYVHVNFFTRNGYFPRPRETDPYVHVLSLSPGRYTDLQETKRVHKYWLQKIITKYFIWAQKIIPFLLLLSTHYDSRRRCLKTPKFGWAALYLNHSTCAMPSTLLSFTQTFPSKKIQQSIDF